MVGLEAKLVHKQNRQTKTKVVGLEAKVVHKQNRQRAVRMAGTVFSPRGIGQGWNTTHVRNLVDISTPLSHQLESCNTLKEI